MAYKKLKFWFDKELAELLSKKILDIHPEFNNNEFIHSVDENVQDLELKDRVELIADKLHENLDGSYPENINLLLQILGPENSEETGMFSNFYWIMPIAKYIEKYGLDHFEISINAIKEITKRNTGEYTIRAFLETDTEKTLGIMHEWSVDENVHIRRLSSEGVRPRLPWAKKLDMFIDDPKPILPILDNLKDDSSKFVQKSVANCMNDILKDNPKIGMEVIESWKKTATKERRWIIKHSLRTLVKQNNEWANGVLSDLK